MEKLIALVDQIADSTASVLINGESGTGKEVFARYIHEKSSRRKKAFVAVNCAALPESLLESELFGYEKGAFTGAATRKPGKFEIASGGTILLDEITEMQPHLQSKLLRVIQEREVDRIGGISPVPVDVRIIATTNRDIRAAVDSGSFRDDLYYRLSTIPLNIPSLKKRPGDIPLLAEYFISKYSIIDSRNVKGLTSAALSRICSHDFPGNVRELENMMHRAVLLARSELIAPADLMMEDDEDEITREVPLNGDQQAVNINLPEDFLSAPLRDVERHMIFHTLEKTQGNRTHAAKLLGISVRTLRNKLNEYREEFGEIPADN
jgi:two-component system response regulator FlrC